MSLRQTGYFDYSKSPYYLSLFPFQRRTFPAVLKPQVSKEAYFSHPVQDAPSVPLALESKALKKHLKAGQSELNLRFPQQRADRISAMRHQLKDVIPMQLETVKQQKREEAIKALLQKRREIVEMRAANAQKVTSSRSELLEAKRVLIT